MLAKSTSKIEDIVHRCKAGYPMIWVVTEETPRAVDLLRTRFLEENKAITSARIIAEKKGEEFQSQPKTILYWDALNGLINITNYDDTCERIYPLQEHIEKRIQPTIQQTIRSWANQLPKNPTQPEIPECKTPDNCIILVNGIHNLLEPATKQEYGEIRTALLQILQPSVLKVNGHRKIGLTQKGSQRTVILIGPNHHHDILSQEVMALIEKVELPKPNVEEIEELLLKKTEKLLDEKGQPLAQNKEGIKLAARELRGTTLFQAENALYLTYIKKRCIDLPTIQEQHRNIIESHRALKFRQYKERFSDIVGFELCKDFLLAKLHKNAKRRDHKGILILGVSGGGKSLIAKATGNEFNLKTLTCTLGRIFHRYIGDSEENTENLLNSLDALGECIVFLDEIEKALPNSESREEGTSARVSAQLLSWMQDHKEGSFIIGACNDPQKLSLEAKREGRWDATFYVPPPYLHHRVDMATMYANLNEIACDPKTVAARTKNWVGAEIKGLFEKAATFRVLSQSDEEALEKAFRFVIPQCEGEPDKFYERLETCKKMGVNVHEHDTNTEG
jgi:SpoVK/Ycf46/Vps4 family AAA+-type ATPase